MSETSRAPQADLLRSPLGRARGLGASHTGSAAWWGTKVSSLALVPLTLWFIWSMLGLLGASREDVSDWLAHPTQLVLMLALILMTFYHMKLGLETVVEDYVHQPVARLCSLLAIKAVCLLLGLACAVAVLRLGL
jgi:succinate dehydrogenase / fumarate reductase, membrane anchor subunit